MLKYSNTQKTAASFNGASFSLAAPEDFTSIGDGPTRDAVLKWIAAGNVPVAIPLPTLPEVKTAKLASLEGSRDAAIAALAPVTVAGKQYPATPGYREIVSNLARRSAAGKPIPATLRGADGVPVTLTAPVLGLIDDALAGAINAQYDKWGTKFDLVQAATTVEAVNAVVW